MAKLSSLTGEVVLNINQWSAGIKQVERDASALGKSLGPITRIAELAGGALLGIAGAAAGALAAATKISADYGDKIRDASVRTGLTTEALSGLKLQAEQSGTSFESLNSGLAKLSKNFGEVAATGKGKAAEAFNSLGISVKELRDANGNLDPVLRKVMDRMAELPSASARAAAGTALMGKGFDELQEFMAGGSASMDAFRAKADLFGVTVGQDAANAADDFNDSLNNLKQAGLGLSLTFGNSVIPALTEFVSWSTAAVVALKDWVAGVDLAGESNDKWVKTLTLGALAIGQSLIPGFEKLVPKLLENKAAIDAVTDSEKKSNEERKQGIQTLAEKTELEKKHAQLLQRGLDEIAKLRSATLAKELKEYQDNLKDQEKAAEHRFGVAMKLITEERDAKLKALNDVAIAEARLRGVEIEGLQLVLEQVAQLAEVEIKHLENVAELGPKVLRDIEGNVIGIVKHTEGVSTASANKTQQVWATAVGNITSDFARGLSDVIFEGRKFGDAMKGIAKSTAKSMFDAFLSGLLTPLTSKLAGLGAQLGGIIFGGGAAGSATGGGLSGAGGGILGGILGGGGSGGGVAGGALGMSLGAAALSSGIGVGVPLLIQGIGKIGEGRRAANEIVKSQEAVVAAIDQVIKDSSLSATNRLKIAGNLFEGFQSNTTAFAAGGGANAKVANQAFATLAPWWANVQSGLQREIGADPTAATGPQTVNNYNINIMVPEGKNARSTGALFRDEMIPILIDAIRNNTGGLTAAVTVSVKNSLAGAVTTA